MRGTLASPHRPSRAGVLESLQPLDEAAVGLDAADGAHRADLRVPVELLQRPVDEAGDHRGVGVHEPHRGHRIPLWRAGTAAVAAAAVHRHGNLALPPVTEAAEPGGERLIERARLAGVVVDRLHDLGAGGAGDRHGVVGAVVGDDEHPVGGAGLSLQRSEGGG